MVFRKQFIVMGDKGLYFADPYGKFFFINRDCSITQEGIIDNVKVVKDNGNYGFFQANPVELEERSNEEFTELYGMFGYSIYIWKNKLCLVKCFNNYMVFSAKGFECVVTQGTFDALHSKGLLECVNTSKTYIRNCIKHNAGAGYQNLSKESFLNCLVKLHANESSIRMDYAYNMFLESVFSVYDGAYFDGIVGYSRHSFVIRSNGDEIIPLNVVGANVMGITDDMSVMSVTGKDVVGYCKEQRISLYSVPEEVNISRDKAVVGVNINGYDVYMFAPDSKEGDRTEKKRQAIARSTEDYIKHVKNMLKRCVNPVDRLKREREDFRNVFGYSLV